MECEGLTDSFDTMSNGNTALSAWSLGPVDCFQLRRGFRTKDIGASEGGIGCLELWRGRHPITNTMGKIQRVLPHHRFEVLTLRITLGIFFRGSRGPLQLSSVFKSRVVLFRTPCQPSVGHDRALHDAAASCSTVVSLTGALIISQASRSRL
jgi:hypothetical protein